MIDICIAIMDIFHLMPAASAKLIEPLIQMVLKVENFLVIILHVFVYLFVFVVVLLEHLIAKMF